MVSRYPSIRAWGKIWINVLDKIKATLGNYRPHIADTNQSTKKAAVAVILRPAPGETLDSTEILFIKRAERDGDPWSGHMAFPGGHMEPDDSDLKESAIRETKEEIGLDLRDAQFLDKSEKLARELKDRPELVDLLILVKSMPISPFSVLFLNA